LVHAHIQRPLALEAKTAPRIIKLGDETPKSINITSNSDVLIRQAGGSIEKKRAIILRPVTKTPAERVHRPNITVH
jgi:hypothetical protein